MCWQSTTRPTPYHVCAKLPDREGRGRAMSRGYAGATARPFGPPW